MRDRTLLDAVRTTARPLRGEPADLDRIVDRCRGRRFILLGEASHGTHEFYQLRADLTRRLITELGCAAVAAEADWPDAYRINRFARGLGTDGDAAEALGDFRRFPQWMWRNSVILDFIGWLRSVNEELRPAERVGFYGMDLYSLHASIAAVLDYLDKVDPAAARRARDRYACFEDFAGDPQGYGYAARFGMTESCERAVLDQLQELRRSAAQLAARDGRQEPDEIFFAEQNARLVRNAERYYRAMFGGRSSAWNLRDQHMAETLEALAGLLASRGRNGPIVVWAHNSHLGDARATEMGTGGELNVGQLVRERHAADTLLIGFTTYDGTVTVANDWDGPAERMTVRPGRQDSYEGLFHEALAGNFLIDLRDAATPLPRRLERAIGGDLPARHGTPEPLLRGEPFPPVRHGAPPRSHARARADGANGELGRRRAPRDLPDRTLTGSGEARLLQVQLVLNAADAADAAHGAQYLAQVARGERAPQGHDPVLNDGFQRAHMVRMVSERSANALRELHVGRLLRAETRAGARHEPRQMVSRLHAPALELARSRPDDAFGLVGRDGSPPCPARRVQEVHHGRPDAGGCQHGARLTGAVLPSAHCPSFAEMRQRPRQRGGRRGYRW